MRPALVPTGPVRVQQGTKVFAETALTAARKGVITLTLPRLAVGSRKLTARYLGNTALTGSASRVVTLRVVR